ncbi:MAG: diphthine--ammonia ligase [Candidatus Thermoplasmatota archaeon]|nr:diphthine--ammonia ligase [Candidatus Thermoplasmatota archaeon]
MKALSLFSGGKDSTLSSFLMLQKGFDLSLLTILPEKDSMMYHYPNIELTAFQAKAMGLSITYAREGDELEEFKRLKEKGIEAIVCGAVKSDYQRTKIEGLCYELGLKFYAPLWNLKAERIYRALFDAGFRFIMSSVSAEGFDENWLGKEISEENIAELFDLCSRYGINPVFEGGEAETFVFDGPLFRLTIKRAEKRFKNFSGVYEIKEISG